MKTKTASKGPELPRSAQETPERDHASRTGERRAQTQNPATNESTREGTNMGEGTNTRETMRASTAPQGPHDRTRTVVVGVALFAAAVSAVTTWSLRGEPVHEPAQAALPTPVAPPTPSLAVAAAPEPPRPAPTTRAAAPVAPLHARRTARSSPPPAPPSPIEVAMTPERAAALGDLDRCIAGDGKGCAGVGRWYETSQHDPASASKWFEKGCDLSSFDACDAVIRLNNVAPTRELATRTMTKSAVSGHPEAKL